MKTAVITGTSSGIGEALARRLAGDGWRLLLVARRADRLESLSREIGAVHEAADLTDQADVERVAQRAELEFQRLDLLVNNAGGNRKRGEFGDPDYGYEYVREIMDQNFDTAVRLTDALLPFLRRSAPSAIVNVGSIAAGSRGPASVPTTPRSSLSTAGPRGSTTRRRRTACTWASSRPGSSRRKASRRSS